MEEIIDLKRCNHCHLTKPISDYHKDKNKKDGFTKICKACNNEKAQRWYEANSQRGKQSRKAYYEANRDRMLALTKAYRDANRERLLLVGKKWREENADKKRHNDIQWHKENPEKVRLYRRVSEARRRAQKMLSAESYTADDLAKLREKQKNRCICCLKPLNDGYHADHVMPLSKGGSNGIKNIQLLCQRCNNRKHAKDPIQFMQEQGFLL